MKIKYLVIITLFMAASVSSFSQTIVTIAGEKTSTDDFLALFNKNNYSDKEKVSVEDYMKLYINFKLKVKEAEVLGLDKDPAFINELKGYRDQLAKPYLVDEKTNQHLINEAYNNMKYDIRASHILINLPKYATGHDTVEAWNKIMDIRNKAINGADFFELAYKYSDDPSAREREYQGIKHPANKGDLGYFTAFNMIYPFEHVAYQTKVGDISMPFRSDYGYHIIYVTDKQPAMGKCTVSHIMFRVPDTHTHQDSMQVIERATIIYDSIMSGKLTFSDAAKKYSEDETSAKLGGQLTPFFCAQIEANFIKAITQLKDSGQISKPFFSIYGCHIIQLQNKTGIGTYDEELPSIKRKISQSDRITVETNALIDKLKKNYNFKDDTKLVDEMLPIIEKNFHSLDSLSLKVNKTIFSFNDTSFTQNSFITYMSGKINDKTPNSDATIKSFYNDYVNESLLNLENDNLESEYPEFRRLIQEYHDGILLFNVNDKEIWSKSTSDSVALINFYEKNVNNYIWKNRVKATIFKVIDPSIQKEARKLANKGMDDKELVKQLNKNAKTFKITMETGTYEENTNPVISKVDWKIGVSKIVNVDNINYFVRIYEVLPQGIKSYEECKGLVISDYQNYLENQWLETLKAKYPVVINQVELDRIK